MTVNEAAAALENSASLGAVDIASLLSPLHDAADSEIDTIYEQMSVQPFALDDMLKAGGSVVISKIVRARTSCLFRIRSPFDGSFAGFIGVTSIIPMRDAEAQSCMWDRSLRHDRISDQIALIVMGTVFEAFALERMSVLIASPNLGARRFVERIGFVREGRHPRMFKFDSSFHEGLRYGIVRSEAMERIAEISERTGVRSNLISKRRLTESE